MTKKVQYKILSYDSTLGSTISGAITNIRNNEVIVMQTVVSYVDD